MENLILKTDSYKLGHWNQYPTDTQAVYSYFESRRGAQYDHTVFFGLQYILVQFLDGSVVTHADLEQAYELAKVHFGDPSIFNYEGWLHVVEDHHGYLPLRIKAVPEGTVVPANNVMMTVENTCEECFWLTNAVESLLTHVWYPSTVATLSYHVKQMLKGFLERTADNLDGLDFMLHDFGYRGASSDESAAIGGAGHLVNFKGTDTLPAMLLLSEYYSAPLETLAFSVPATEHSVMTAQGYDGEFEVVQQLLGNHQKGILSVVADSYNIYEFVKHIGDRFKVDILKREGTFVVRPDSVTPKHATPPELVVWILKQLWLDFGGTTNSKGYKVLDPHVRVLWGDGIDPAGIKDILTSAQDAGFSAENLVFGMGGGLLQKVNRDTQRFAFKCSARKANDKWQDVSKNPLDQSKASKKGRLALIVSPTDGRLRTLDERLIRDVDKDLLETVFENGYLVRYQTLSEIRANAHQ